MIWELICINTNMYICVRPISEIRKKIDKEITIVGTLPPLSLLDETPEHIYNATLVR